MSLKGRLVLWILKGLPSDGIRRKLFIAKVKPELDKFLKEDREMEGKPIWQSKTVWTAIIASLLGAVQPVSAALGHPIEVPTWVYEVLGGFGLYALRSGQGKPLQ